jgi:plasmid stability protein
MSTMIQVRNVPDGIHRVLKTRAAKEGVSLSSYCLAELRQSAEQPTLAEMRERLERRPRLGMHSVGAVDIIREVRDRS